MHAIHLFIFTSICIYIHSFINISVFLINDSGLLNDHIQCQKIIKKEAEIKETSSVATKNKINFTSMVPTLQASDSVRSPPPMSSPMYYPQTHFMPSSNMAALHHPMDFSRYFPHSSNPGMYGTPPIPSGLDPNDGELMRQWRLSMMYKNMNLPPANMGMHPQMYIPPGPWGNDNGMNHMWMSPFSNMNYMTNIRGGARYIYPSSMPNTMYHPMSHGPSPYAFPNPSFYGPSSTTSAVSSTADATTGEGTHYNKKNSNSEKKNT
jgi:hypothetical protein